MAEVIEHPIKESPRGPAPQGPGNGGGGNLINYRLAELERRMENLETGVKQVNDTVIEINTTIKGLANKSYVLTIFGVTGGLAVLTFIGHIALRTLGN